jgi:hypothetical protein
MCSSRFYRYHAIFGALGTKTTNFCFPSKSLYLLVKDAQRAGSLRELSVLFYPQKNHMKEHFFHPDTPS